MSSDTEAKLREFIYDMVRQPDVSPEINAAAQKILRGGTPSETVCHLIQAIDYQVKHLRTELLFLIQNRSPDYIVVTQEQYDQYAAKVKLCEMCGAERQDACPDAMCGLRTSNHS